MMKTIAIICVDLSWSGMVTFMVDVVKKKKKHSKQRDYLFVCVMCTEKGRNTEMPLQNGTVPRTVVVSVIGARIKEPE